MTYAPLTLDALLAIRQQNLLSGVSLPQSLATTFGLDEAGYLSSLGTLLALPTYDFAQLTQTTQRFDLLPFVDAVAYHVVLIDDELGGYRLLLTDPLNRQAVNRLQTRLNFPFQLGLTHPDALAALFSRHEESQSALDQVSITDGVRLDQGEVLDISLSSIASDDSPVIKLINSTLYDALKSRASDIHLETNGNGLIIKYRIDGVLLTVGTVNNSDIPEQAISRLKILSELDISERRIPQDGRFKAIINHREIDFRVSIMPSLFGEDAVLRILDKQSVSQSLTELRLEQTGLSAETQVAIRKLANEPYGMVLVTGPTGSGKTTTLYAILTEINHGHDKIITIEDPIEYQLHGVLQIPVNEKKGLSFSRGLRSILRHDPDKIMVGEIRDADTAQIAVQAALTGHLVLTSVHANDVFSVIGRFLHMGVEPGSFVDALNGIVAQRLMRTTCPHCSEAETPSDELLILSGLTRAEVAHYQFRVGRGCSQCRGTGFHGRKAIAEVLRLSDELRQLINDKAPAVRLKEAASRTGYRALRQLALDSVASGETSLQEINRVTFAS